MGDDEGGVGEDVAARAARVGAVAVVEGELAGVAQVAAQRGPAAVEG